MESLRERLAYALGHTYSIGGKVHPEFGRADAALKALGLYDLDAAVERAAAALSSFRLTATPDSIEGPWCERMAAVVLEAALTATEEGE